MKRLAALLAALVLAGCCGIPSYTPSYWNGSTTVRWNNNCYNYANNKRTDTFAQPGRAAGAIYTSLTCQSVAPAAAADGLDQFPATGQCACNHAKLALVVAPGDDYHWYRRDANGMWTHKPGGTAATNLDNSGNPITNPETANRGRYTVFCGYFCSCSSKVEGSGHETIN